MNNFTNFKSFKFLFTAFILLAFTFITSCGGDDEATPDCGSLELSATVEGNTITASATGGDGPYVFSLNGVEQSGTSFTDLEPGTYAVEVTDANECTDSQSLQVIDPCANFSVSATASAYEITIALTSGEAPFDYIINYGGEPLTGTSDVRSFTVEVGEAAATEITVTDATDCAVEAELTAEEVRTFTDSRDGQEYLTIKIGDQIWFAENLNFETENNSYCYDDDPANCETYGRLYTWDIAQTIAPEGWKLPSEADFQTLINVVGGGVIAAEALVEGGDSGFEFQMAGRFYGNFDEFDDLGTNGFAWTTNSTDEFEAVSFIVVTSNNQIELNSTSDKVDGRSIRFIKM